jgi:hypothetical protein
MTGRTKLIAVAIAMGAAVAGTIAGSASANGGNSHSNNLRAQLSGFNEDPLALSTTGAGQFRAQINEAAQTITYRLSYTGLEGTVTQSHIHIGGSSQSGGIAVFLCSNLGNGPATTQACPVAPATISGTITPADVIGPTGQGVTAGQFDELVAAIQAGATYVNVHSSLYPGGEIRDQLD